MRRIIIAACIILLTASFAHAEPCAQYGSRGGSQGGGTAAAEGGSPEATPDGQWNLDDNTSGTAVVATYGSNGVVVNITNTSDVHSTDRIEGTGSFQLAANDIVRPAFTQAWFTDEIFTIQWTIKGDGSGPGYATCRFVDSSTSGTDFTIYRNSSDTSISIYIGTVSIGAFTVTDFDDGQWHTFRLVVDGTNDVCLYQKIGTGAWGAGVCSSTNPGDVVAGGTLNFYNSGGGDRPWGKDAGGYYGDQVKIWNAAVAP